VRDLGDEARIEVDRREIHLIGASAGLKKLGYKRVTVDRRGYRTGSLNEKIRGA
jgi:PP-loop superfamily ATP-utilizing enzyme